VVRIAYVSVAPFCKSGYGRCTAELVYRLLKWFEVDIFAYHGLQSGEIDIVLSGSEGDRVVKVIGGDGTINHPKLPKKAPEYDIIFFHYDTWLFYTDRSKDVGFTDFVRGLQIHWLVGDQIPVPHPYRKLLNCRYVYCGVPMTNWFRNVLLKCPDIPKEKVGPVIYHGVDPRYWFPVYSPKLEELGLPKGEFTVFTIAPNVSIRENIPNCIEGFAIFLKKYRVDAYYIIRTNVEPVPGGYYLKEIVKSIEEIYDVDLSDRIVFITEFVDDSVLRVIYSQVDVLLNPFTGSFELPILEAALCDTPTIGIDFGGVAEVLGYGERGLLVKGYPLWANLTSTKTYLPDPESIAEALYTYYVDKNLRKKHTAKLRSWILKNATWDVVAQKFKELFECVYEEKISYGRAYYVSRHIDTTEWTHFNSVRGRVLEVGCGTGELLSYLRDRNCYVVGIDISKYAVKKCREFDHDVVLASATHIPFKNNAFNYVVSQHTLEHVGNYFKVLDECLRVAKKQIHVLPGHRSTDPTHKINHFTEKEINEIVLKYMNMGVKVKVYPEGYPRDWVLIIER